MIPSLYLRILLKYAPAAILALAAIVTASCSKESPRHTISAEQRQLYRTLDEEIKESGKYQTIKESRIRHLRKLLSQADDDKERFEITNRLIDEYDAFTSDSAIHYINLNLQRPSVVARPDYRNTLLIRKADLYAHAGLFQEALDIMSSIRTDSLDRRVLEQYYATYCALYQYLVEYNVDVESETAHEFDKRRMAYADSLLCTSDSTSLNYLVYVTHERARSGEAPKAISILKRHLGDYPSGTREYSILASILAYVYKTGGDEDSYIHYLTESAISDVRGAVKENMSFRAMATYMYENGDIERANRYLKKSIADANFFSARMRNAQSVKILPVIDEAYTLSQSQLKHRLEWMIIVISLLAAGLIVALYYIRKQYKRLKKANAEVASRNAELSILSNKLKQTNAELAANNASLSESNMIKEQYTGFFMEYSSTVISTLQKYHHSLKVLAGQGIAKSALLKKLDSSEFIDTALREFYARFDEAILNIYPEFIGKVNSLMKPDGKIQPKEGEILNTELRVLALIRIGITDSNKIAGFLRCSITTVYTYRSKLRHRAIRPDEFEAEVGRI